MFKPQQKSAEQIHKEAWVAMHRHEWLFPQNFTATAEDGREVVGPANSEEYLSEFARKNRFFLFRCPAAYRLPLLEKLKEKVAFSSHLVQGAAVLPYTVLQLDGAKAHAIADWMWDSDNEEFVFPVTLFLTNQLDYVKFIDDNAKFECVGGEKSLGFGAVSHG